MGQFQSGATNHGQCGFTYNTAKQYDRATEAFTECLRLDPKFRPCYRGRAFAFRARGEVGRAEADANAEHQLEPVW